MRAPLGDPFRRREGGRRLILDLFNPFRPVGNEAAGAGPALVHQIKPTARIIERAQIRIVDVDRGAKRAMGYDLRVWGVRVHCEVSLQHNSFLSLRNWNSSCAKKSAFVRRLLGRCLLMEHLSDLPILAAIVGYEG